MSEAQGLFKVSTCLSRPARKGSSTLLSLPSRGIVIADGLTAIAPTARFGAVLASLPFDPRPAHVPDCWPVWKRRAWRDPDYGLHRRVLTAAASRLATRGRVVLAASPAIGHPTALGGVTHDAGLV